MLSAQLPSVTSPAMPSAFPGFRVLLVEDVVTLAIQYRALAARLQVEVVTADTVAHAQRLISKGPWHAALLDLNLPDGSGFEVIAPLLRAHPACSVVVITAEDSHDNAVRASRAGAFDYVEKPVEAERLLLTLRNALHAAQLNRQLQSLQQDAPKSFEQFIGSSAQMQTVYRMIDTVAASNASVCITGESGTGKELAAQAIHARSSRKAKKIVPINCAAIPKELMESELFGHVKGAFTGAVSDRPGAFIEADKGTLFLDEIADLDLSMQAKLLRVLQTGEVKRVGEDKTRQVDVRIVCATHNNLAACVKAGRFREDLFYRLYVVPLELPPLRVRGGDIALIAQSLLRKYAQEDGKVFEDFSPEVVLLFNAYPWPGNVRELGNTVQAIVALHDGPVVTADMLPDNLRLSASSKASTATTASTAPTAFAAFAAPTVPAVPAAFKVPEVPALIQPQASSAPAYTARTATTTNTAAAVAIQDMDTAWFMPPALSTAAALPIAQTYDPQQVRPLDTLEREAVDYALRAFGGNVAQSAKALRINPSTLYRKIQSWAAQGLEPGGNP